MLKSIRQHPLMQLLKNNRGNPRTLILMEPLWGIPFNLIAPFTTLFMYLQGVTDRQIGLLLSLATLMQVFFSFTGGMITDRLGRKVGTMIGDFIGWAIPCFIWMVSNNFWLFLLALAVNSIEQIGATAWTCLLVEDAEEKDMFGIFTWVNIGGLVAVFFAPLAGIFIQHYSLIPVMRVLYGTFAVSATIKTIITYLYCRETKQGEVRMAETKETSVGATLKDYKTLVVKMLKNNNVKKVVSMNVITRATMLISSTFFGLYMTRALNIPESYLAFFPILNAAVMLAFMVGLQRRLEIIKFRWALWIGLILLITGHALLILMAPGIVPLVALYILILAIAHALIHPRQGALLQLTLDVNERARMNAVINAVSLIFLAPFGYIAGFISSIDQRLPFVLSICLFLIAILIVKCIEEPKKSE